jgi:hypothetical protein
MADSLRIDLTFDGGLLCRLWCWAFDTARPDGDISWALPPMQKEVEG